MLILQEEYQHLGERSVFDPKMVLQSFLGSPGLFLGALRRLLGALRASRSTKKGLQIHLGTLLGLVCSPLAAEDGLGRVLGPYLARFGCSRWPLEGCFGIRHADFNHQNCPAELRYHIFSCCCCCCRRFPLTWQLLLDSARRNERSD